MAEVPPTRMNQQIFKVKKKAAEGGYKLLKKKADALKVRFLEKSCRHDVYGWWMMKKNAGWSPAALRLQHVNWDKQGGRQPKHHSCRNFMGCGCGCLGGCSISAGICRVVLC